MNYYHVTKAENLPSILGEGLNPSTPNEFEDLEAVYLFPDRGIAEDAAMNWMGDRFDEDTPLALLEIDGDLLKKFGITVKDSLAGYEKLVFSKIPAEAIKVVSEDF